MGRLTNSTFYNLMDEFGPWRVNSPESLQKQSTKSFITKLPKPVRQRLPLDKLVPIPHKTSSASPNCKESKKRALRLSGGLSRPLPLKMSLVSIAHRRVLSRSVCHKRQSTTPFNLQSELYKVISSSMHEISMHRKANLAQVGRMSVATQI
jgi:hypothetical protein